VSNTVQRRRRYSAGTALDASSPPTIEYVEAGCLTIVLPTHSLELLSVDKLFPDRPPRAGAGRETVPRLRRRLAEARAIIEDYINRDGREVF
jgi:hypothetical protein